MKNLLFSITLLMTMMLASCSSDNDGSGDGGNFNPLIGFWQASDNNNIYYYEFQNNATAHFWFDKGNVVEYQKMAYSINDNKITLVASDGRNETSTFEVKNNNVIIYDNQGTPLTLSKANKPSWIEYKDINRKSKQELIVGKWNSPNGYDIVKPDQSIHTCLLNVYDEQTMFYKSNVLAMDYRFTYNWKGNYIQLKQPRTDLKTFYVYVLEVTETDLKLIVGMTEKQYNDNWIPTIAPDTKVTTYKRTK